MKKIILILSAVVTVSCSGQSNKKTNNTMKMDNQEYKGIDTEGYVSIPIEGGMEYRKGNILYIFRDGALTTVEQLGWGGDDKYPESYAYIYEDTPNKIVYTDKSGDKSRSITHIEITLRKAIFYHKYNSKDGQHVKEYEMTTPLDIWIKLSQTFNWDKFSELKSGASEQEWDGSDKTITVETKSGTFSVTNYRGNELEDFFKVISDYLVYIYEKAVETKKD